jgi:GxxExxY protein
MCGGHALAHEYSRDDHHNDGFRGADGGRARPAARGRGAPGGERRGIPLSDLNPVTTDASRKVIGCAIDVHKALGPGYTEAVYTSALRAELDAQGVKYQVGPKVPVKYRDAVVGEVTPDLLVEGRFIVDVMARPGQVDTGERMALRAQLKAADLELGLIINFSERRLKDGLVRVVNIDKLNHGKGGGDEDDLGDDRVHDFEGH